MTLIDFRYKEFTSIVTAFAVVPTQRERSIGIYIHSAANYITCIHVYIYTFSRDRVNRL